MSKLQDIIDEESVNALGATMLVFARQRGLLDRKLDKPAALITAEFSTIEEERKTYPLTKSIKNEVDWALTQGRPSFAALYAHGEEDNLRRLIRTIVCGEMLNVMQDRLEEVMKTFGES